ncbi:hypothetical protein BAUCODRAFT_72850 [Baudoinia panamericana UAMH 10762]|uniref:Centromere protein S n=1 Tax=Baudoinia panamericana (strain UAMH 10762) TaxID=717646 RepID=M2MEC3_BAUPA|nr:uncharacterized protein BAUCODRAFT_72850 [Baudoinia panamericana UAMH 10762]EMC94926.1 hypothetical protein BAUCODRAFT_72850 [Baudoinia panamericana UAMH 10762]
MPGLQTQGDTSKEERLKAALWHSVGSTVDAVCIQQDINATPHFIAGLNEMCFAQIENIAHDLEAFAKHCGRGVIGANDVVLLGRRNDGLSAVLRAEAKAVKESNDLR